MKRILQTITYVELASSYAVAYQDSYHWTLTDEAGRIYVMLSELCEAGSKLENDPQTQYVFNGSDNIWYQYIVDTDDSLEGAKWISDATEGRIEIDTMSTTKRLSIRIPNNYEFYKERSIPELVTYFKEKFKKD